MIQSQGRLLDWQKGSAACASSNETAPRYYRRNRLCCKNAVLPVRPHVYGLPISGSPLWQAWKSSKCGLLPWNLPSRLLVGCCPRFVLLFFRGTFDTKQGPCAGSRLEDVLYQRVKQNTPSLVRGITRLELGLPLMPIIYASH
ncbi:hypothetical protein, variant [Exophiala dermatitidis NIH/UT8656]|uniref:Uncharacterized protein n=1 Tax=Exophiala dermatitidis (strain ATCC 34100 / CBS 525.76 / NIH/UT8656) TaxID=858893 RepID=H6CBI2_EXODN|nr:uncharacterized protein HMPREF1120_09065 [Exophiala dermatitidis NIH/UT8656]XP_009161590.1 hypothetical protein, variant [Exophiala dermatitidis NIH/UT8656]EHY61128.1 hypothetical protein, variant [Exophiala dermatitidis NIH/UT8656]EHY61129.1 hypothetical protein HMPREF1120_09065 [Exophiala dermatitidis NIH/UT8656]